ncbi:putative quercetin 2,3-dioxygenase [Colletotrichum fructicola]|nr:putative quercetin 2,3-dioxygenase [Colletotrichum fructicola]
MLLETREKSKLTRHDERFIIAPALFAASEQGHDDIVKMFLESLEIASKNGHSTVVKTILETRNTSNFLNQYEPIRIGPALKVATYDEGATIVKALLNTGRTKFDRDDGAWALSLAAEQEGDALVRLLLTSKADCNGAFRERAWKKLPGLRQERPWNCPDPPLEIAAKNGNHAIASLLLDTGKVSADSKRRSLNHAIREGHPAIVDLLLSSGKFGANVGESMLYAASRDKLSVVKLLYEKWKIGLGLTTTDILKDGPIVAAIENGSASVFEYLLDAGKLNVNFEFNWRSRRNRVYRSTLLRKAADDGQLEIMRVLLAKKANVNLRSSKDGATALSVALLHLAKIQTETQVYMPRLATLTAIFAVFISIIIFNAQLKSFITDLTAPLLKTNTTTNIASPEPESMLNAVKNTMSKTLHHAKITPHRSGTRGHSDHGWLNTYHSFSFADWYDPRFNNFGALRVLNEDRVKANSGFPTHPHRDFEIFSYILSGELTHRDSMLQKGSEGAQSDKFYRMHRGDVQFTTGGTGIAHSEMNEHGRDTVHFLQIWAIPWKRGLPPTYHTRHFAEEEKRKGFVKILSPLKAGPEATLAEEKAAEPSIPDTIPIHADFVMGAGIIEPNKAFEWNVGAKVMQQTKRKVFVHLPMTKGGKAKIRIDGRDDAVLSEGDGAFVDAVNAGDKLNVESIGEADAEVVVLDTA